MAILPSRRSARGLITVLHGLFDLLVLTVILVLVAFALYAMWDSRQVYQAADARQYAIYKPTEEGGASFLELRTLNPEVFAWLTVYGTSIDYPVVQGANNEKYVITDVYGNYSLSGSIFLDYLNDQGFEDFNSILYGHHMEQQAMFGAIGLFGERSFFEERAYGSLHYNGEDHGLEFFAFVHTDAYDSGIFAPRMQGEAAQQAYLNRIWDQATYTRDIQVTTQDHLLLLSTCSTDSTNGRDILIARITDQAFPDVFAKAELSLSD